MKFDWMVKEGTGHRVPGGARRSGHRAEPGASGASVNALKTGFINLLCAVLK